MSWLSYGGDAVSINFISDVTSFCFRVITYQAGLPSVEECLQKAEQFCDENKFLEAMKFYLLSSSPELTLDIGLNLVRGKIAGGPGFELPVFVIWLALVSWVCSVCIICLLLPDRGFTSV